MKMRTQPLSDVFSSYPVAACMDEPELVRNLADVEAVTGVPQPKSKGPAFGWGEPKLWLSNAHAFGFISGSAGQDQLMIIDVGRVPVDKSLIGRRVNISLNYLRIAQYPGGGTHRVLFDFYVRNQSATTSEEVHFNSTYRIQDKERAGIRGFPIFTGVGLGSSGLALRCYTVNVRNDDDERFLQMLDSGAFRSGLKLVEGVQPALKPLSEMAIAITKSIASRHRNIPVQDVYLGLDFDPTPGGAGLAIGSYVVVQIPEKDRLIWNWNEWIFRKDVGQVVSHSDATQLIPYNYFIIGISPNSGN